MSVSAVATNGPKPALNGGVAAPPPPEAAAKAPRADARSLRDVCLELRQRLQAFLAEDPVTPLLGQVQEQVRVSLRVVEEAFQRYRPEQISLSYNGGKDCLVLLLIVLAGLPQRFLSDPASTSSQKAVHDTDDDDDDATAFPSTLQAVYIVPPHPFPEVAEFVSSSSAEYHLSVARYNSPMRSALEAYQAENRSIQAIFVGTRRTDPHAEELKHFDPTDAGWPDFMRVHPVIDWHYQEIWAFIRHLGVPYCPLYDQGYTSLGGKHNTHPNPQLKKDGAEGFRPAFELTEDHEERLGRDR